MRYPGVGMVSILHALQHGKNIQVLRAAVAIETTYTYIYMCMYLSHVS